LLLGRTVSRLGDWLTMTAVVTWLYVETRSSLLVSLFLVVRVGATVVGGVLAAPLLDRFTRFRTLWFVEVVRGVLMLATIRVAALAALVRQPVALGLTASFTVVTAAMAILNASLPAFFDRRLDDVHAYGYGMGAIGAGLLCGEALSACVQRDSVARRSVALA